MAPPPNLAHLVEQDVFAEQTIAESAILHDWLVAHGAEYDEIKISVRLGAGLPADPSLPEEYQRMALTVTRHRADAIASLGSAVTIIEAKERITSSVLGQLRTYRRLYLEEHPEAGDPRLLAVGRRGSPETVRVLNAEGIDVLIYERPETVGGAVSSGV